jgi:Short C-terminal domain
MGLLDSLFGGGRMSDPVRGTAQVVSCSANRGRGVYQSCYLQLMVQADGVPATAVEQQTLVHRSRWPFPGMTLPATIDRANPANVRIAWDELRDARNRARQTAEGMAAAMRAAQQQPAPPPPPQDGFDTRMDRLERLARLHAEGALTDDEFAEQKRRLLDL